MAVLPLSAYETTQYNNVPATPATAPLGDIIDELFTMAGGGTPVVADTYDCAAGIAVGDVVFISASNTVDKASAVAGGGQTPAAIGVVSSKPTAITAVVVSAGSQLTDIFALLTPGVQYWLSPITAGAITSTVPSGAGQALQQIGRAVTSTKLLVEIGDSILL